MRDLIQLVIGLSIMSIGMADLFHHELLSFILSFVGGLITGDALAEILL